MVVPGGFLKQLVIVPGIVSNHEVDYRMVDRIWSHQKDQLPDAVTDDDRYEITPIVSRTFQLIIGTADDVYDDDQKER